MDVHVIAVPYDSGARGIRMGAGPERLLEAGLQRHLEAAGHAVTVSFVEAPEGFQAEIQTSFALSRQLSADVEGAVNRGAFPLILAGNCGTALGTMSGIGAGEVGVIWFDAHGDFNTPETTSGGFLDGMALALLTGACWTKLGGAIPGFRPVPARHVLFVGGGDFDPGERVRMRNRSIAIADTARIKREGVIPILAPAIAALAAHVTAVYIHMDIDVLARDETPANGFQPDVGLSVTEVEEAIALISQRLAIRAGAITAYDPLNDPDATALPVVARLVRRILQDSEPGIPEQ